MNEKNDIREEIVKSFSKYCARCKGICCSKEINAFTFEIKKWPSVKLDIRNNWQKGKLLKNSPICRFNIGQHCPFLLNDRCRMSPAIRPIDCLSYPVYPSIDNLGNNSEFNEMMVHKSCPFAHEISLDSKLKKLLFQFWESNFEKIDKNDVKTWLGDKRNYWLDKNIIRIKL